MPAEQVVAVLPLDELILDDEVADLEVQSESPALSRKLANRCHNLLDDQLDRGRVGQGDGCDGGNGKRRDPVLEQIVDLGLVQLVEATNGLLTALIESHLPVHLVQEVVIDDHEDWAYAQCLSLAGLCGPMALVKRVPALVRLRDRAKDGEVGYLDRLFLVLDDIAHALREATPDHVEEAESPALGGFERVISGCVSLSCIGWSGRVPDEGKVQLGEVAIEDARAFDAPLEECKFGDRC